MAGKFLVLPYLLLAACGGDTSRPDAGVYGSLSMYCQGLEDRFASEISNVSTGCLVDRDCSVAGGSYGRCDCVRTLFYCGIAVNEIVFNNSPVETLENSWLENGCEFLGGAQSCGCCQAGAPRCWKGNCVPSNYIPPDAGEVDGSP